MSLSLSLILCCIPLLACNQTPKSQKACYSKSSIRSLLPPQNSKISRREQTLLWLTSPTCNHQSHVELHRDRFVIKCENGRGENVVEACRLSVMYSPCASRMRVTSVCPFTADLSVNTVFLSGWQL